MKPFGWVLLAPVLVAAQQTSPANCDPDWDIFHTANSTGKTTMNGFAPPGVDTGTWTFGSSIAQYVKGSAYYMEQVIWITTNPEVDLVSSKLPYNGCLLAMYSLAQPAPASGNGNGDCTSVLEKGCIDAWLRSVNSIAASYAGQEVSKYSCPFILPNPPPECQGSLKHRQTPRGSISYDSPTDSPGLLGQNPGPCAPGHPGPFAGNVVEVQAGPSDISNFTLYDEMVSEVVPIIIAGFSNSSTTKWNDVRLICLQTNNITAGSRVPSHNANSAAHYRGNAFAAIAVVAILNWLWL